MRSFLAALSLLSCLPLGGFVPSEKEIMRSVHFFPVAGLLFGALFYGFACLCIRYLPHPAYAMLLALAPEVLTKGFHLDGLADTADGFLSSRPRERKLEIMRDSRIGTMGVFAVAGLIGMKFALFLSLPETLIPSASALSMLNGRCAMVLHIGLSRYARQEGLGALFFRRKPWAGMVLALFFVPAGGWYLAGCAGVAGACVLVLFVLIWSLTTYRLIGGATGDTIGACEELCEVLTLFSLLF